MKKATIILLPALLALLALLAVFTFSACGVPKPDTDNSIPGNDPGTEEASLPETAADTEAVTESTAIPQPEPDPIPDVAWSDEGLTYMSNGDGTCKVSVREFAGQYLRIPDRSPDGDTVTVIARGDGSVTGPWNCPDVVYCVMPDTIITVEPYAFYHCKDLKGVWWSSGLESIGKYAFSLTGLRSLILPQSLKTAGQYCFAECYNLGRAILPNGLTRLPNSMFEHCIYLKDLVIPEGVKAIGDNTFAYCSRIEAFDLPDSVTDIGAYAFHSCSITGFSLKPGVQRIGSYAFSGCGLLTSFDFGDGALYEIGEGAFITTKLTEVMLPKSLVILGNDVFWRVETLTAVHFPEDGRLESIGGSCVRV